MSGTVGPIGAALIGAGGAIVGGSLTAGSNVLIENLRRKYARQDDAEHDERELRRAVRLVFEEIAHCAAILQFAAHDPGHWPTEPPMELTRARWMSCSSTLAAHLPRDAWRSVSAAYELIDVLCIDFGDDAKMQGNHEFERTLGILKDASLALAPFFG